MVAADGSLSVLLRGPNANFSGPVNYTRQSGSSAVAAAFGNSNGTLGPQASYALGGDPGSLGGSSGVAFADFNGDGKPDVAAGYQTSAGGAYFALITTCNTKNPETTLTGLSAWHRISLFKVWCPFGMGSTALLTGLRSI